QVPHGCGGTGQSAANLTNSGRKLEKLCRSHRNKRRGAAAVEFAVVAPVFLLFALGMIEYGRMVMVQQVITNASREGARIAVLEGSTSTDVEGAVNAYLSSGSISGASITVTPTNLDEMAFGDPVTVTVDVPFDQVSWLPSPMYLSGKTLSATTVMRRESVQ
ncbi:MAG: TadE/TadG family type IV pilus assembly protein, partial [Planctomycetota bacterium]